MAESSSEDARRRNPLPAALVSNLQSVLAARCPVPAEDAGTATTTAPAEAEAPVAEAPDATAGDGGTTARSIVLLTCAEGIRSAGLAALVDALVAGGRCDVHVCAAESDKPVCGHSITIRETITATSVDFTGAKAFEISGTPVDCVSLALSGRLFSWSAPALVISGISTGSNCGYEMFHSSAIAAAREALMYGVPSIAISLNWKKDGSKDSNFKDAAQVCLPLINAALSDIEKGTFLSGCLLNIGVPSSPSANKGFKLTKQSVYSPAQSWQAVSTSRPSSATHFMGMHQSLGFQLAQLGKDASAAGAARRVNAQRKLVEVESVAAAGKQEVRVVKKLFRAEYVEKQPEGLDDNIDLSALENGFISVTPVNVRGHVDPEIETTATVWLSAVDSPGIEKVASPDVGEQEDAPPAAEETEASSAT